jgi:hypothetical protein
MRMAILMKRGGDEGDGDEDENEDEGEGEDGDEEKDAPVLRFDPPKRHSGSGRVKSVAASVDGKIFIFVTVNFFL